VTANHVFEADELVEVELFMEMVKGLRCPGNYSCLLSTSQFRLDRNNPEKEWFRTSEIHEVYQTVARDVEVEPILRTIVRLSF